MDRRSRSNSLSKSAAGSQRRLSSASSNASGSSDSSSTSTCSSSMSGASVDSWDSMGYASDVDQSMILVNGRIEDVAEWYDNASTKPLPGQHRLRDAKGQVRTTMIAAKDRELKQNLRFTGVTHGKKHRLTFKSVDNAIETVPICDGSIQMDRIPNLSATILVDGKKVKPGRYYENAIMDGRPSVQPFPGQTGIYCQAGNYAEVASADWKKHTKRRLNRYVGYEEVGGVKMRSFRTPSFDRRMGNNGKPVKFMK